MTAEFERHWANRLKAGTEVEETYAVRTCDVRQRRGGGPYLAMTLGDRTGDVAGLVWDNVDRVAKICEPGRVVRIRGQVQRYNQRLQLVVRQAEEVAADPERLLQQVEFRTPRRSLDLFDFQIKRWPDKCPDLITEPLPYVATGRRPRP